MSYLFFSLLVNFPYGLNKSQLQQEILATPAIVARCTKISECSDTVTIWFSASLSGGEVTALNAVISAHAPNIKYTTIAAIVTPAVKKYNNTSFARCATLFCPPSVKSFAFIANKDAAVTSYSIRIVDITNIEIIGAQTFTTEDVVEIKNLTNIPASVTTVEIQIKKTGGTSADYVYVDNITAFE